MLETFTYLLPPFTICLLMVGILSYFGNHILARGIIFIDISLAQIAALGSMIGILIGFGAESTGTAIFSFAFAIVIVSLFPLLNFEKEGIPEEAIIGFAYGLSLALALILAEYIPGGSNFIKKTLTGNILWVTWSEIFVSFLLFFGVGIVHVFFGKRFIKMSTGQIDGWSKSKQMTINLLFFVTFAIVIVKTVAIGGIFVIFTFLIAPASIAAFFANSWKWKILISWIAGFVGSVLGIIVSYYLDMPNGPAIVCTLGLLLIVTWICKKLFFRSA